MKKKTLLSLAVCVLTVSPFAGCSSQPVLTASDGMPIASEYHSVRPAKGTVILLHGLGTDHREWTDFQKDLKAEGWSTLAIDFRGHGLSLRGPQGPLHWRFMTEEQRVSTIKDIEAAVHFVEKDPNIWLVGSSMGANLAFEYAATDPRIAGVVLLSPRVNPAILDEAFWKGYGQRPAFIAGSRDDSGVPESCEALHEKLGKPQSELLLYAKIGHGSVMLKNEPILKKEILKWMAGKRS